MEIAPKYKKDLRNLDLYFKKFKKFNYFAIPTDGWIRTIRKALGLTTKQLGKKIINKDGSNGVSGNSVVVLEKSEINGSVTLNTLSKAAEAMDCELVYAVIPKSSLIEIFQKQIDYKVEKIINSTKTTMNTEGQEFNDDNQTKEEIVSELMKGNALWN